MSSHVTSLSLVLLVSFLCLSFTCALHDGGFTWSSSAVQVPSAVTDYAPLIGPQASIYQAEIYLLYKPPSSTAINWQSWNWQTDRTWTSPRAVDNANSYGGGSIVEFSSSPVAAWSDATTSTLTFSIQDTSTGVWGSQSTTTYSAHQSPPGLFTPISAEMYAFHRQANNVNMGNCTYDGYSVFEDYPSGTRAYSSGTAAINFMDVYYYFFYLGANADGTPTGYIHWMKGNDQNGVWSADMQTPFPVDTDSTLSAVAWSNNTDTYLFVFYKYQNQLYYFALTDDYNGNGHFVPTSGSAGYPLGLSSSSGPSAVVYYDSFYDEQVVQVFYSQQQSGTNNYLVMNAIGLPDSWP